MNAEIISVGTELLLGQIVNSNARFLSQRLAEIGINVYFHTAVGDNPKRLEDVIRTAQKRSDLLIFTGGLGPTKDDLTKETIAHIVGKSLRADAASLQKIERYYQQRQIPMTANNRKQGGRDRGQPRISERCRHGSGHGGIRRQACVYAVSRASP